MGHRVDDRAVPLVTSMTLGGHSWLLVGAAVSTISFQRSKVDASLGRSRMLTDNGTPWTKASQSIWAPRGVTAGERSMVC